MTKKAWVRVTMVASVASVVTALMLIGPEVPDEIWMLTGPAGSSFHADAALYRDALADHGVTVHLVETGGSIENLSKVAVAEAPTAAFVWGIPNAENREQPVPAGVQSLGTMSLQPLWVFGRKDLQLADLEGLTGQRVDVGDDGSDSRLLALFLLREEGVDQAVELTEGRQFGVESAEESAETIAAVIAVGETDSPVIDRLLRSQDLEVMSIRRARGFAARYRTLLPVRFPEGSHDLRANIPDHDVELVASRSQLVVSKGFPPSIVDLLMVAATDIHGDSTPFSDRSEFPNRETVAFPLNRSAQSFYTHGPPTLQKYLPFRLASLVNRFLLAGVALASALTAIFKVVPSLISLPFRIRLRRAYLDLGAIERSAARGTDLPSLRSELDEVDRATAFLPVPFRNLEITWLEMRQYLHDMRDRLQDP